MVEGKYAANVAVCCGACYLHCNKLNLQELADPSEIDSLTRATELKRTNTTQTFARSQIDGADSKDSTLRSANSFINDAALSFILKIRREVMHPGN